MRSTTARRQAAADLVSRVRPIWPEPIDVRVSRRARPLGAEGQDYLVLPALRRPVLLVPAHRAAAAGAIVRFDDGQRARLLLRVLAWAQAKGVLRRLPIARISVGGAEASGVLGVVERAVPDAEAVVVRLGRPRHGRAVILNALDADGQSLAFTKCAWGDRVVDLRQESDNLAGVASNPVEGVRAPEVLAFVELDGSAALVLEALTPAAPATQTGLPVVAMRALAERKGWHPTTVADSDVVVRLQAGIGAVVNRQDREWLQTELVRLVVELGGVGTRTGTWHGDWVPWNMARDGSTILLWDWEHNEDGVLPGFDQLHYLGQEMRQRLGTSPDVEDTWLAAARAALADDWGVTGAEAEAVIRSYLLVVNLRFVFNREGDPLGQVQRSGWSRSLLERLGGDA